MRTSCSLKDKKVLITRSPEQASEFSLKLEEKGAIPVTIPLISIKESENHHEKTEILNNLHQFTWIFFTSKNGVEYFFKALQENGAAMPNCKFAVVGEQTGEELKHQGYEADFVPTKYVADVFVDEIYRVLSASDRVLFVKGNISRRLIPDSLAAHQIPYTELTVYCNYEHHENREELITLLKNKDLDVVTFLSPSAIQSFVYILEGTDWQEWLQPIQVAVIGPSSEKAARKAGVKVDIIPKQYTIQHLIDEIEIHLVKE